MTRTLRRLHGTSDRRDAVLALHSLGLDGGSWAKVAANLGAERAVYTFDQLAHGSQRERAPAVFADFVADAGAALSELQADRVHLVGHSLGGAVAAHLAAQTDDPRLASVTLIATPARGMPAFAERAHACRDGSMVGVVDETLTRWFEDTDPSDAVQSGRRALGQMTPEGFDACWRVLAGFPGFDGLPGKSIPAQVFSFAKDRSTPPQVGAQVADALRPAFNVTAHHVIDGAGHMGVLTHGAEVAARLADQWAEAETKTGGQTDARAGAR